jgi:hypothetical protein
VIDALRAVLSFRFAMVLLGSLAIAGGPVSAQNSTRKLRAEPSELAGRAGAAIGSRDSLTAALAAAQESGRLVFWYVPTLRNSPMDRKVELDRMMAAGPFSWPAVTDLLAERFVVVKAIPNAALAREYELTPVGFIEPGFLVLDASGAVLDRVDQITTLSPRWFVDRLGASLAKDDEALAKAASAVTLLERLAVDDIEDASADLRAFADGARRWWSGDEVAAEAIWRRLIQDSADSPWAAKAAAELESHGPLTHGFEIPWSPLPDSLRRGQAVAGTQASEGAFTPAQLATSAVRYFATQQRSHGGFVDSRYDFGGTDSLPNVWTAITALAGLAALELQRGSEEEVRDVARRISARALDYVEDEKHLALEDRDELIWAHIYCARFGVGVLERGAPECADRARSLVQRSVAGIVTLQPESGAWFHEYANPFVIASCLLALAEARRVDVLAPQAVIDRGVLALLRCRAENGAYSYGYSERGKPRAAVEGGVGRMPHAELALLRSGHGSPEAMQRAIEASFEWHDELAKVRKYDDHASRHGYGGFFFWFDVLARTEAIAALADGEFRSRCVGRQRAQILALPEIDGCFVDSHELGRVYGTAMAHLCLGRLEPR